ncbi:hypothetical protein KXD93_06375 [Mucilaginibacter sp. BJC16-A38]|uniref:hypothetical protein n=1 Tax=Mucilaginibacter phenanthrenivorans TaxID=1234842 RepID=UPI0021582964|nr:hypothetical protein [Mucilaginibacter phenanthrenivorans]MCR8557257.1 hypothetical protein [Mucilaginibacter phenanthrenivorans]
MGKQHDTFPNEQPEMPVPEKTPEINKPADPREPEIPNEDPQVVPDEFPPEDNPPEESPANPGI